MCFREVFASFIPHGPMVKALDYGFVRNRGIPGSNPGGEAFFACMSTLFSRKPIGETSLFFQISGETIFISIQRTLAIASCENTDQVFYYEL